ncbi:hypothetical protein AB395_00006650 (plasmid) [Sinorhizobium fredii CCBAU 45436]|nr:hypothetical protein AB395_00006650 [Sinorhizobium fredii CCBAU 45436]CEO91760.1 conserved hypothetical protein [Sinorhizobium fredii HH103]
MNKSELKRAIATGVYRSPVARFVSILGRERPASAFFLIFAAALVLPVLLFGTLTAWTYVQAEKERAVERAQALAHELSAAVDRELAGPRLVMEALATSEELRRGDLQAFHPTAAAVADSLGLTIVVRAPGQPRQLLNTSVPWGTPLPRPNPAIAEFDQRVPQQKRPVITNIIVGQQKRLLATVIVPVLREDEVIYLLAVGIPVERLQPVFSDVSLDEGWLAAIVDSRGMIAARSVDPEAFVGKQAPSDWISQVTGPEGLWRGHNLQNVEVVAAYARPGDTNWFATVTVPISLLNAPIWKALATLSAIGVLLLSLSVALASWAASHLTRAVGALQNAGLELEKNEHVSPVATPVREINSVGRVLAAAATEAQRREAHLRSILATVPSAMVVIDSRGRIQSFSATAEKLFGFTASEVSGKNVNVLMPEPDRSAHDSYLRHYLDTGERRIIGKGRVDGKGRNRWDPPHSRSSNRQSLRNIKAADGVLSRETERPRALGQYGVSAISFRIRGSLPALGTHQPGFRAESARDRSSMPCSIAVGTHGDSGAADSFPAGVRLPSGRSPVCSAQPRTYCTSCSMSNSRSAITDFVRSPMEIMPTRHPFSRTGRCLICFSVISAIQDVRRLNHYSTAKSTCRCAGSMRRRSTAGRLVVGINFKGRNHGNHPSNPVSRNGTIRLGGGCGARADRAARAFPQKNHLLQRDRRGTPSPRPQRLHLPCPRRHHRARTRDRRRARAGGKSRP